MSDHISAARLLPHIPDMTVQMFRLLVALKAESVKSVDGIVRHVSLADLMETTRSRRLQGKRFVGTSNLIGPLNRLEELGLVERVKNDMSGIRSAYQVLV